MEKSRNVLASSEFGDDAHLDNMEERQLSKFSSEFEYPSPTVLSPSSSDFRSLILLNSRWTDCSLHIPLPPSPSSSSNKTGDKNENEIESNPLFFIENSTFTPSKASVTLYSGSSNQGEKIGELKLKMGREDEFRIFTGEGDGEEWGKLKRVSKWTHSSYCFDFNFIPGKKEGEGQKKRYTWQRTKQGVFDDQPDLELRENVESGGDGEVLAVYKGCQGLFGKRRGEFWVRRGVGVEGEGWSTWGLTVLLTGCGIIEGARRRSRARRSGGGASGG